MKTAEIHQLVTKPLVIAVSSRALFDLEESHRVFVDQPVQKPRDDLLVCPLW